MRIKYRKLRIYAVSLTASAAYLVSALGLLYLTKIPLGAVLLLPVIAWFAAFLIAADITDPRKCRKKRQRVDWDLYSLYEVEPDGTLGRQLI